MRLRSLLLIACASGVLLAACSKMPFKTAREIPASGDRVGDYDVGDSEATKKRLAVQDRLSLASQRLRSGDLVAAEREAGAALKASPDSADAHTLLAVIKGERGEVAESGVHYKRAAELAPAQGGALNNYGAWLCGNGFPAEALVWFDRALAAPGYRNPESALANAGGCALKTGQYDRAERDLRRALSIAPQNAYALASMAESEYRQNRYFEARAFTERRLAAAPATAAVLQLASDTEEKLGDKAAASRYVQRLRAEFPDVVAANPGDKARP